MEQEWDWNLGVIGCGVMGGGILRGVHKSGLIPREQLFTCDADAAKARETAAEIGIHACESCRELLERSEIVILAAKPQGMRALIAEIAPHARSRHLVVSIAAGIPTAFVAERLLAGQPGRTDPPRVIRAMPNTPATLGCGATGLARGAAATDTDLARALSIFRAFGKAVVVPESQMNAVTALSGSGPAYVYLLIELLARAGEGIGLAPETALELTLQTVVGAARMSMESGVDPAELRRRVTTPHGTTEAAMDVFEDGGLEQLMCRALAAADKRGAELAAETS